MNLYNIPIFKIKNVDYYCVNSGISRSEAMELLKIFDLTEKGRTL